MPHIGELQAGQAELTKTVAAGGGVGGSGATTLDGLTDVTLSTPTTGQVLKYNGTAWVNDTDATGGGGSATITAATVSVPYGSRDYLATVTDAGVSGASKIMLLPGFYASTDENEPAEADMTLEAAASGNFLVRLTAKGRESIGGVFKLQYLIG